MITTSSEWDSLCQVPGLNVTVLVRMYYGDGTSYKPFASRDINAGNSSLTDTDKYLGVIGPIPSVIQALDMKEHTHSIQSLTLEIDNLKDDPGHRWSDLVEDATLGSGSDVGFYNRQIDIRLFLEGVTTFANCFPLLTNGIIRDIQHSREYTTIQIEDRTEVMNYDVTTLVTDSDAADTAQGLPEESRGRVKPIPIGDHRFYKGDNHIDFDTASAQNKMTPCVYLGIDSSNKHRWLVSEYKIYEIDDTAGQEQVWGWDDNTRRYVRLSGVTVEQNTADGCIISHAANPSFIDYWHGRGTVVTDTNGLGAIVVEESYCIDKNWTTYTELALITDNEAGHYAEIEIPFPEWDNQGIDDGDISDVTGAVFWEMIVGGGAGADYEARIDTVAQADPIQNGTDYPETRIEQGLAANTKAQVAAQMDLRLHQVADVENTDVVLRIYQAYKIITYAPNRNLPLYFGGQGIEYGAWINNRDTGAGYTENHVDSDIAANTLWTSKQGTELIAGVNNRNFAGANQWENVDINAYDETGDLTITASAKGQYCYLPVANAPMSEGGRYIVQFDVANIVSRWELQDFTGAQTFGIISANGTDQTLEFTVNTDITGGFRIASMSATSSMDFDNVGMRKTGPIQNAVGVIEWLLRDATNLDASQPEHLNETDFATHAKWDVTGQVDDTGGNAAFVFAGGSLNGTLIQTSANRVIAGTDSAECVFQYTCAVTVAPDGNFYLRLGDSPCMSQSLIYLTYDAGTHKMLFKTQSGSSTKDFKVTAYETSATEGSFTLDDASLKVSLIDADSFNIASNDYPTGSFMCSAGITEPQRALDLLFALCRDFRCWLWWQTDGKIKIKVMEDTYASSNRTIDARDFTGLGFERTPLREIKTAADVRYDKYEGRHLSSTGTISADTNQQAKYNVTQAQSLLIHEASFIGDSTTATDIGAFKVGFWKQPHNILTGELDKLHLDLDLGDIIEISNMPYDVFGEDITSNVERPAGLSPAGQTIYKYWWIFYVERSDRIYLKAIQLHDLS
ncbi:hypothetical protein ACFL4K_00830 [Candidatus Neomarinimicrobiota bacterium]